jgi:1-acyl-sn-glycerol-3-phosphate acyltransferase
LAGLLFVSVFAGARRQWRARAFRYWAKSIAWLLGLRLSVQGTKPVAPFLLVANHLSYVDVIALGAQLDCLFVAKSEVAAWPVLGLLGRQMSTIFIDRNRKRDILRVNRLIEAALSAGQSVALFPEGTTTAGDVVLPFKSGLLEPAVKLAQPVAFASLSYRTASNEPPASQAVCWWGEMEFLPHLLELFALPGFEVSLRYGAEPLSAPNRKQLAKALQAAVSRDLALLQGAQTEEEWRESKLIAQPSH